MTQILNEINPTEKPDWEQHITLEESNAEQPALVDNAEAKIPDTPEQVRTKLTFSQAGLPTIILVGTSCLGGAILLLMLFKATIGGVDWSGGSTKAKTATKQQVQSADEKDQEISRLKAQLMMGQTAGRILASQKTKPSPMPVAKPTPTPSPSPAPVVRPAATTVTTPIQPRPKVVTNWEPVDKSTPVPKPVQAIAAKQKSPEERALIAANIGSFGSVSSANNTQLESASSDPSTDPADNYQQTIAQSDNSTSATTNDQSADSDSGINGGTGSAPTDVEQSSDSNYQTTGQLIVGTKASAKLETGVAWSGSLTNATQSFRIQLREPLLAADNTVVIPKEAYLVARVDRGTNSGLLEMSVVSVLLQQKGRTIEKPLPETAIRTKAIRILSKDGNYLQAKATRTSNASNNVGMMLLSGASRVAGLSNQLEYQSTYRDGDFTSTTSSRDPNYLAGFGQGAASELLRQQRNRSQEIQRSVESQPNVFVLKQGTSVQVYVNQSLSLE